ncbi:MAG: hypothetical protein JXD18_12360 [Anaerolineae bacterium]|nr:hypothetical protein [Anaerolineae bacterium]
MSKKQKSSQKYPLLVYTPIWDRWGNLGVLVAIISVIFWIFAPKLGIPLFADPLFRHLPLVSVFIGLLMFFYGLASRKMAYVQCFPKYIRIQTPIYPLMISYKRVEDTRLVQVSKSFDINKEKKARNSWPQKYWGMTAIAVDLKSLPSGVSARWLHLWFDKYLFNPERLGFILIVDDWTNLSKEMGGYMSTQRVQKL